MGMHWDPKKVSSSADMKKNGYAILWRIDVTSLFSKYSSTVKPPLIEAIRAKSVVRVFACAIK